MAYFVGDRLAGSRLFRGSCCIVVVVGLPIVPINPMVMKRVRFYCMVMVLQRDPIGNDARSENSYIVVSISRF